jgi:methyl-accepting chemotaxis protein
MKIKFKLSILIIVIMAVAAAGIIILLLRQAYIVSINLRLRSIEHLTNYAEFWKAKEDGYVRALHTLANVMGDYESIKAEERRDRYDELLKSAIEVEPQMVLLYTIWKPNAIDGMDEQYIGRTGSSKTGQYAMTYSKETGSMVKRVSNDINNVMAHITGPTARKDRIDNLTLQKVDGNDRYTMRMMLPITNDNEIVGALGCLLVINVIQQVLENTIKTNDEVTFMAVYSYDGTVLAHSKPERIGRNILDVDVELGDSRKEMFEAVRNGNIYKGLTYDPLLDDNIRFLLKPIQIGNSNFNLSVLIGVSESYISKEIKAITRIAILIALIAVLVTAGIIFVILLGFIAKPTITVTDTLKDISDTGNELAGMTETAAVMTIYLRRIAGYRRWKGNLLYSPLRSGFLGPYHGNKCS